MGIILKLASKVLKDDRLRIDFRNDKRVPEFLHFNNQRHMLIAQTTESPGYFIFSSPQGYDKFKANSGVGYRVLDENGVGEPLLYLEYNSQYADSGIIGQESCAYIVYTYLILTIDDVPQYDEYEVVKDFKDLKLEKKVYCKIYQYNEGSGTRYEMVFEDKTQSPIMMVHQFDYRDMDTNVFGSNFRWHVKYSPIINNDHYKLALLKPEVPTLLDEKDVLKSKENFKISKSDRYEMILGHYTSENSDFLPRKVERVADFIIGEQGPINSLGLLNVPKITKIFACQSLLIHALEIRKRNNRQRNGPYNNPFLLM